MNVICNEYCKIMNGKARQSGHNIFFVCVQMFLTVYLSNGEKHFTEVPLTPETLCRDIVDVCKEPGETDCYLAETWRGSGGKTFSCFGSLTCSLCIS